MANQSKRAVVLAGGSFSASSWEIGLLAGLASAGVDLRASDLFIGTSAGARVALLLAAGMDLNEAYEQQLKPLPRLPPSPDTRLAEHPPGVRRGEGSRWQVGRDLEALRHHCSQARCQRPRGPAKSNGRTTAPSNLAIEARGDRGGQCGDRCAARVRWQQRGECGRCGRCHDRLLWLGPRMDRRTSLFRRRIPLEQQRRPRVRIRRGDCPLASSTSWSVGSHSSRRERRHAESFGCACHPHSTRQGFRRGHRLGKSWKSDGPCADGPGRL